MVPSLAPGCMTAMNNETPVNAFTEMTCDASRLLEYRTAAASLKGDQPHRKKPDGD